MVGVAALIGGVVSRQVKDGSLPWWAALLPALLSGLVWAWMCKQPVSLAWSSLVYDVVATLTYTAVFVATGDRLSPMQWGGLGLAVLGLVLLDVG